MFLKIKEYSHNELNEFPYKKSKKIIEKILQIL